MTDREALTLAAIDAVNREDPETELFGGESLARQLILGQRATWWVDRLEPDAVPVQRVAARGHHLRRFGYPRSDYPEGRAGYLRWRRDAKSAHASELAALMDSRGWSEAEIGLAKKLVTKAELGSDPLVQTHEDAICLAFLEVEFDSAAAKLGDEKTIVALRKTAAKMSPAGLTLAGQIAYSDHAGALLASALAE